MCDTYILNVCFNYYNYSVGKYGHIWTHKMHVMQLVIVAVVTFIKTIGYNYNDQRLEEM